jgi:hypothetical protein
VHACHHRCLHAAYLLLLLLLLGVAVAQAVLLHPCRLLPAADELAGVAVTLADLLNPWLGLGQLLAL